MINNCILAIFSELYVFHLDNLLNWIKGEADGHEGFSDPKDFAAGDQGWAKNSDQRN